MNFASTQFVLLFLPLTLCAFWLAGFARGQQLRMAVLIGASAIFYGVSGWSNVAVLAGSVAANYAIGRALVHLPTDRQTLRKQLMWLGIALNLGLLLSFKSWVLIREDFRGFNSFEAIALPLALSFITFQKVGFLVACYKRTIREITLSHYLFFVLFFPTLVLGPISRYQDIDAQLREGALLKVDRKWVAAGIAVFSLALLKKVGIANPLADLVNPVFAQGEAGTVTFADAWLGALIFQFQLFFDFTAYGEMAIALAMMVGMKVPLNFERPYHSRDRAELWNHWHISFSAFIRDNLFLPLVRHARFSLPAALAITGLLSGLWHGLGLTFVIWGLAQTMVRLWLHYRLDRQRRAGRPRMMAALAIALTFTTSVLLGVLFRSPDLETAGRFYAAMLGFSGFEPQLILLLGRRLLVFALVIGAAIWIAPDFSQLFRGAWHYTELRQHQSAPPVHWSERWLRFQPGVLWGALSAAALLVSLYFLQSQAESRFIYVQF